MTDIPLRNVQVIWDYSGKEPDAPSLFITGHPEEGGSDQYGNMDDPNYSSSWGACNADFLYADEDEQLLMLFEKFQELVTFEGLDPKKVHEAFCVIPEYRVSMIWRGLGQRIPDDLRNPEGDEAAVDRLHERRSTGLR